MGHKDVSCALCGFTADGYNPNPAPVGRVVVLVAMLDEDADLVTRYVCAWNRRAGTACTVSNAHTWADREHSPCLVTTLTEVELLELGRKHVPF